MRDFSVVAVYVVHYGSDYLEYSLRSIYNFVDKIIISVGMFSWSYNGSKPIDPIFLNSIFSLPTKYPKVEVITGEWEKDEDQRNATISFVGGYDYYFLVDYDEIYADSDLIKLYEFVSCHKEISVFCISFLNFWRGLGYLIQESNPSPVQRFFKIGRRFRFKRSCLSGYKKKTHVNVPENVCKCFHLSYAKKSEEIKYKISTWMHVSEVRSDWFETVFMEWHNNKNMHNLYPLSGSADIWQQIIEFDKKLLPIVLREHPYYEMDVID